MPAPCRLYTLAACLAADNPNNIAATATAATDADGDARTAARIYLGDVVVVLGAASD